MWIAHVAMALLMRLFICCLLILLSVSNVSGWKTSGSFDSVAETAQQASIDPLRSADYTGQFLQCVKPFKHNADPTTHCLARSNCFRPI
ncbi:unnamed protein product [Closterium sp. Yama58-4]|nr:unnamed protein product [Closterium sp. Yama58-4]